MEQIHLSKRMEMNISLIQHKGVVADVGCDHAYVALWLCQNEKADKVIAMDVNDGPVKRAIDNVKKYNMQDRISVRKSDGVGELIPKEADIILIGGMGGMLIEKILTDSPDIVKSARELILQPQSEPELVRKCIRNMGFVIDKEKMIIEDRKYYNAIHCVKGNYDNNISKEEWKIFDMYGKYLLDSKDEVLRQLLTKKLDMYSMGINKASKDSEGGLIEKILMVKEGLRYYGM